MDLVRIGVPASAILIPLGFFLSVASPRAERPGGAIQLVYWGAAVLAIAVFDSGVSDWFAPPCSNQSINHRR